MQTVKRLESYIPLAEVFEANGLYKTEDVAFLDSSLENELGRYSILGLRPYLKLVKSDDFTVNGQVQEVSFESYLRGYLRDHHTENETGLPITAGALGYFSYEYGRKKEEVSTGHQAGVDIPDCILIFYDLFLIEDLCKKELYASANGNLCPAAETLKIAEEMVKKAQEWDDYESGISKAVQGEPGDRKNEFASDEPQIFANFEKEEYKYAVDDMIRYIIEGDIYIANMTQQLCIKSRRTPYEIFRRLRRDNPSPFGGFFNYGDFQVVCSSPERFLRVERGHVVTRPIKGTRKRGVTKEEDRLLRRELMESEKDKSELLMIVDLERNDLNRVCVPGSVKVTELFSVEEYATVFHLIANVEGELEPDMTIIDLLEAAFPGGSITGAPKRRAMEIIDELEHDGRGLYTGSMGYLTLDGGCDFNIVIRTVVYKDGCFHLGVGGGITYESDLEFEYEETLQKAKAILEAMK